MVFTVTSPTFVTGGFQVAYSVGGGNAVNGTDFTLGTPSPLAFAGKRQRDAHDHAQRRRRHDRRSAQQDPLRHFHGRGHGRSIGPVAASNILTGAVGTGTILDERHHRAR